MRKLTTWIAIMSVLSTTAFAEDQWVLEKDKKGIKAYTQKVEDRVNLGFRGVMNMTTDIPKLISVMRDVSSMDKWLHTCYDPKLTEQVDEDTRIIHMKNDTPTVFVAERDLVLEQKFHFLSDSEVRISLIGKPDAIPKENRFVRIPYFEGSWHFKQLDGETVEVVYEGVIDPGGYIPAFVTNLMVVDTPYETLSKLSKFVKELN